MTEVATVRVLRYAVDPLYLDHLLSRTFLYVELNDRSLGHLHKPPAKFLSLSRVSSISNFSLSSFLSIDFALPKPQCFKSKKKKDFKNCYTSTLTIFSMKH